MIDLVALEAAIIERLKSLETSHDVKVLAFPDRANSVRAVSRRQALVGFQGRTSSAPAGSSIGGPIIQTQEINFEIVLELQDLRSHTGAYPVMNQIRELLTGFRPADSQRSLYETSAGFVGQDDQTWTYSLIYRLPETYQKRI